MNSDFSEQNVSRPFPPNRLKWPLIVLLFGAATAGLVFGTFKFSRGIKIPQAKSRSSEFPAPEPLPAGRQTIVFAPGKPVVCQGTIIDTNKRIWAVFNQKPVTAGDTAGGAKILKITPTNVVINLNGQTQSLLPGGSFIPAAK